MTNLRRAIASLILTTLIIVSGGTVASSQDHRPPNAAWYPKPCKVGQVCAATVTATVPNQATLAVLTMIENHGVGSVTKYMPKVTALGKRFGYGTNVFAITHPSKPNYLATWSGSTQGETSNRFSTEDPKVPSLFDVVYAHGGKVKTYAQSMGSDRCRLNNHSKYVFRHNPETQFTGTSAKRALCERYNFDGFDSRGYWKADLKADKLGVLNHVLPDNDHNWHDGSAKQADDWISARANEFIASQAYRAGGVMIITADEDERKGANDIPLIIIHRSLDGVHKKTDVKLTLYDVSTFLAEIAGVKTLAHTTPHKLAEAFGLQTS